jgi:hypothetical protein
MRKRLATIVLAAAAVQGRAFAQAAPATNQHQMVLSLAKVGQLDLIDPGTLKVIARIPVGGNPHEVIARRTEARVCLQLRQRDAGRSQWWTWSAQAAETVAWGPSTGPHGLTFVGNGCGSPRSARS